MALMRANNRQGAVHSDGLRIGLKVTGSVENGGLVEHFFGKDGKARLQHDKFVEFLQKLQDEVSPLLPSLTKLKSFSYNVCGLHVFSPYTVSDVGVIPQKYVYGYRGWFMVNLAWDFLSIIYQVLRNLELFLLA